MLLGSLFLVSLCLFYSLQVNLLEHEVRHEEAQSPGAVTQFRSGDPVKGGGDHGPDSPDGELYLLIFIRHKIMLLL